MGGGGTKDKPPVSDDQNESLKNKTSTAILQKFKNSPFSRSLLSYLIIMSQFDIKGQ